MLSTAEGEANGTSVLYFFVSDIELVASTMSQQGVTFVNTPHRSPRCRTMSSGSPSSAIRRVTPHSPMAYTECQSKQLGSGGHLLPAHRRERRVWCFHFAGSPRWPAQWRTDQGVRGTFIHASRISRDVARSSCLDLGDPTFVPQARRVEPCRPRALRSLARIGGLVWSSGEYNSRGCSRPVIPRKSARLSSTGLRNSDL
jgi:hypothetical protein